MIRTIIWLFFAALALILTLPLAIYGKLSGRGVECTNIMIKLVRRPCLFLAGLKCRVRGTENIPEGPVLYVANHQSDFDVAAMLFYFGGTKGFIAKVETRRVPIAHLWLENLGCVYINRDSVRESLNAIKAAEEKLRSGYSMVVFPEGHRTAGPQMDEFKAGALRCALKAEVPIVPVAIDGTYHVFEERHLLHKTTAEVSILPPIITKDCGLKTAELSRMAQSAIQDELTRLRSE